MIPRRFPASGTFLPLALLALLASSACAGLSRPNSDPASAPRIFSTSAIVGGQSIALHLAAPPHPRATDVLVLYASGDGGWFGAAVDMFEVIGNAGFYAVGFSTKSLLRHKPGTGEAPSVAQLADDYRIILDAATTALGLPDSRRVVLTGWSRGASLAVLIGGARHAPANLAGIVAIGLAERENLATESDTDDEPDEQGLGAPGAGMAIYPLIGQVTPRRSAVIQASGDGYLKASRARELFGPDSDVRRFYAVTASNHRFRGGAEAFGASLRASLDWIAGIP